MLRGTSTICVLFKGHHRWNTRRQIAFPEFDQNQVRGNAHDVSTLRETSNLVRSGKSEPSSCLLDVKARDGRVIVEGVLTSGGITHRQQPSRLPTRPLQSCHLLLCELEFNFEAAQVEHAAFVRRLAQAPGMFPKVEAWPSVCIAEPAASDTRRCRGVDS